MFMNSSKYCEKDAAKFQSLSNEAKELYSTRKFAWRACNSESTLAHMLMHLEPNFLEINDRWVDMLLEHE